MHRGTVRQAFHIHRLKGDACPVQSIGDGRRMGTVAHQDGHIPFLLQALLHDLQHLLRFRQVIAFPQGMYLHGGAPGLRFEGPGRRITDCAAEGIVPGRQHLGKGVVDPVHDAPGGPKVHLQAQWLQGQVPHPLFPGPQEQAHLRLAETVDGLHGIAHQEQAAPIPRLPARGQIQKQLVLVARGVLKLIHQQMVNAIVQFQGQIRGTVLVPEGAAGAQHDLRKIHLALGCEHQLQMRGGPAQDLQQRIQYLPFVFFIGGRRQHPDRSQQLFKLILKPQFFQERRHLRFLFTAGRKTCGLGDGLPPLPFPGKEQMGYPLPLWQIFSPGGRQGGQVAAAGQYGILTAILRRNAQQGQQGCRPGLQGLMDCGQPFAHCHAQGLFQSQPFIPHTQVVQPLVAPGQHIGQQLGQAFAVIVPVSQQQSQGVPRGIRALQFLQQIPGGFVIQLAGILGHGHAGPQAREQRRLSCQILTEGINGAHPQTPGVRQQLPALLPVPGQGCQSQLPCLPFIGIIRQGVRGSHAQGGNDAVAHFRSRLAGEGDGHDLFRVLHPGQQHQKTLGEQSCLS